MLSKEGRSPLRIHDDEADARASAGRREHRPSCPSGHIEHPEAGVADRQELLRLSRRS